MAIVICGAPQGGEGENCAHMCILYDLQAQCVFFTQQVRRWKTLEEPQFGHEVYDFTQKISKSLPSHQGISTKVKEEI